jgi:Asp/Glu/hydantoin racemase
MVRFYYKLVYSREEIIIKKIAVIHTTAATIESLSKLIKQVIGEVEIINILDDSILKDMIHRNHVELVEKRWLNYAEIAASLGVDSILSACSSVGEFAEKANELLSVPVYRIDEAMAEKAVEQGNRISVFATLESTLEPTVNLVKRKAAFYKKDCSINTVLIKNAYEELMNGNRVLHNAMIQEEAQKYAATSDVIVLAQASMASALEGLKGMDKEKVLTSPFLGISKLKHDLDRMN